MLRHDLSPLWGKVRGILPERKTGEPVHRNDSCIPVHGHSNAYPHRQHEKRGYPQGHRRKAGVAKDYEIFMRNLDFATKLCKPRHPFTKGKVERLVCFVKENFLVGRVFWNVTDLNRQALEWCNRQNGIFHRAIGGIPHEMHTRSCLARARVLKPSGMVQEYLCPTRRISFDGFVNYEGRRFGVPYSYTGNVACVMRQDGTLYIYSSPHMK